MRNSIEADINVPPYSESTGLRKHENHLLICENGSHIKCNEQMLNE
jgi:hypothetical protein